MRRTVIVTLKTGEGFRGVLFDADREAFVLRNTQLEDATATDRNPVAVDGELVVLRADIAFMQFV
jgi:hypothetical protein